MQEQLISIKQAALKLRCSLDTLRRWDKTGKLRSVRKQPHGHRYYIDEMIEKFLIESKDVLALAKKWMREKPQEPEAPFYCQNSMIFKTELARMEKRIAEVAEAREYFPLIVAIAGEIGNNSFDHNLGNWPDIPGIFFGYRMDEKVIVLADRGRGILQTLRNVKGDILNDKIALHIAFTEVISGRAPEARGNGLKFVRESVIKYPLKLFFQTGDAVLTLKTTDSALHIVNTRTYLRGCLAMISF